MMDKVKMEFELDPNNPKSILRKLILIRKLEESLITEYPNQEMRCPVHFSIGQEAIAVGISAFLDKKDWVVSNHRSHAHYIAKQANLLSFIAELYGKEAGCCSGRGGSMHLTDLEAGFLAGIPIVGSAMPIAAGLAMYQKKKNINNISVVYIGDAAVESGAFHETLNFVSLHNLPLLTICENNEYSIFTPLSVRQPANREITDLARSHGIKTFSENGDDVVKVLNIASQAINYMKAEKKPAFIEFKTYRLLEHCGPNFDDDLNYRDPNDVKNFTMRDPLKIYSNYLIEKSILTSSEISKLTLNIENEVKELIAKVKNMKPAEYDLSDKVFWSQN